MTDTNEEERLGGKRTFGHGNDFSNSEVNRALRNHGSYYEGIAQDITPATMHYLLCHFDVPQTDPHTFRLEISGHVKNKLSLTLDDIKSRPAETHAVTLECAGNGRQSFAQRPKSQPWNEWAVGTAEWLGTPLAPLLEEAGLEDAVHSLVFTGEDRGIEVDETIYYQRSLTWQDAMNAQALLVYGMNGEPLPAAFGFPLRLIVPRWYGMASVKWLSHIEATDSEFDGYYMKQAYRNKQSENDPGKDIRLQRVRSVIAPPGIKYRHQGDRLVQPGSVEIQGKAWSGAGAITNVEISLDGGQSWQDAQLGEALGEFAWTPWTYNWQARPGAFEILSRATDSLGNTQPFEADWNYLGMENNSIQRVSVVVAEIP